MNTDTYLHNEFLGQLGSTWTDAGQARKVRICPNVVRVEDTTNKTDLLLVYGKNGEGEFQEDLNSMIVNQVGYDILAFLTQHSALSRFQERFLELFGSQPDAGRVKLATLPSTSYNEELRAYAAQWRVRVRA